MDLLNSLKNMGKVVGVKDSEMKKKTESLQEELMKIDNELFELEKKYGEFRVKKAEQVVEPSPIKNISEEEIKEIELPVIPKVEESRLSDIG